MCLNKRVIRNYLLLIPILLVLITAGFQVFAQQNASIVLTSPTIRAGETVLVEGRIEGEVQASLFEITLHFDPGVIQVESVEMGAYFGQTLLIENAVDNERGEIRLAAIAMGVPPPPEDNLLFSLRIQLIAPENAQFTATRARLGDLDANPMNTSFKGGFIRFQAEVTGLPATEPSAAERDQIAFTSDRGGDFEIYVMNADGTDLKRLTNEPAADWAPVWSPDGTQIAFTSNRNGSDDIFVMDANGTNVRRLTDNPGVNQFPAWSPDGTQIAFHSQQGNDFEVYVMNADGSNLRNITQYPAAEDRDPAWSPDGNLIAFTSLRSGERLMYIAEADASAVHYVLDNTWFAGAPEWSPDEKEIIFHSRMDGNPEVYVVNADGTSLRRLTDEPADDMFPTWSSDGAEIVFQSQREGNWNLYIMNADGSNVRRLTEGISANEHPSWRPTP